MPWTNLFLAQFFVDQICHIIFCDISSDINASTEETLEGARWLQKSSDLGHKRAQRDLGFLFVDGREDKGISRDCKKGVFYLLTAGLFGMVGIVLIFSSIITFVYYKWFL